MLYMSRCLHGSPAPPFERKLCWASVEVAPRTHPLPLAASEQRMVVVKVWRGVPRSSRLALPSCNPAMAEADDSVGLTWECPRKM